MEWTEQKNSSLVKKVDEMDIQKNSEKQEDVKNDEQKEKIVSNSELGITYREEIIDLPLYRQKELGIKRIRRKELIDYPDDLRSEPGTHGMGEVAGYSIQCKHWPIYDYLTDGRFTSFKTLNHKMFADTRKENREKWLEKFKKESLFFQKYDSKRHLDVSYGPLVWGSQNLDVPLFFFGNKNKSFVNYLNSILSNDNICKQIKKSEFQEEDWWKDGEIKFVKDADSKLYLYAAGFLPALNFDYRPETLADHQKEIQRLLVEKNVNVFMSEGDGDVKLEIMKMLLDGKSFYSAIGHTSIPTGSRFDIPELRWCHSEFAIIPTRKTLNVLFFET